MSDPENDILLEFHSKGLIAGLDIAIEGINIAITTHKLTGVAEKNFRELQRILQSTIDKYSKKMGVEKES